MAIKSKTEELDWNVDLEVQLFYAMRGHKPVGVNRHFQMACIHEKFRNSIQKDVSSRQIWDHLESMYDMAALHESEIIPFPNEEADFILPEIEYTNTSKKEEKVKEDKTFRVKESPVEEKDSPATPSGKQVLKERLKEPKESDASDSSAKRKRNTRQTQQDQSSKPSSPANTPPVKRRRN